MNSSRQRLTAARPPVATKSGFLAGRKEARDWHSSGRGERKQRLAARRRELLKAASHPSAASACLAVNGTRFGRWAYAILVGK